METYAEGPYVVEEGYAMVDEDGEVAHQHTFAETPEQAARLLLEVLGFDRHETERDAWRPEMAVRVTDTNIDYRTAEGGRQTVLPWGVWERYRDPYVP